ncbi:MAG: hypothetical protein LBP40_03330, partial [Campylobacteraceae bacterium]|nr:hypothetical protein [Campylobacteraceae bacterium]
RNKAKSKFRHSPLPSVILTSIFRHSRNEQRVFRRKTIFARQAGIHYAIKQNHEKENKKQTQKR